jgi:DNA-binding response OmpR family regulator
MRILIADDEADAADSRAALLVLRGHEVFVAYDGCAALAVAAAVPPEAAILDLGLPGMDGFELLERLRSDYGASMRLIAFTGWSDAVTKERALTSGFNICIAKPVAFDVLVKALNL